MNRIAVVGLSMAGVRAAGALREQGYDGELLLIGDEAHVPYDRPPLSKDLLTGTTEPSALELADAVERDALGAQWLLGQRATGLGTGFVQVEDKTYDVTGAVITTGARARTLPGTALDGVHVLRTLDDALAIAAALGTARHVVIIGGGFIGAEVASSAVTLGKDVTMIDPAPHPLAGKIGQVAAGMLAETYLAHGVNLRFGATAEPVGDTRVTQVRLSDGSLIDADLVVVGIGTTPNTEWLAATAVECDNGVLTDAWGRTSLAHVVAAGDVARFACGDGTARIEHWTNARDMPQVAVRALLADLGRADAGQPHAVPPYFWSDQFGIRLQVAGTFDPARAVEVVDGSPVDGAFVGVQHDDTGITAVLGWNAPREFTRTRRQIATRSNAGRTSSAT